MNPAARARLFDATRAFDHPVTLIVTLVILVILIATPLVIQFLVHRGKVDEKLRSELMLRPSSPWIR